MAELEQKGSMECKVKLEVFEGPMDLLLYLIKKNEIDIHDIPMAVLTSQYLEYLSWMQTLNLDVASEYLVMAATLVHIKSKMLVPNPAEADDEDEDDNAEDPRQELVRRLMEYQKFKSAAEVLSERDVLGRDVFSRPVTDFGPEEEEAGVLPEEVSLFELLDAFRHIMASRKWDGRSFQIDIERISLADRIQEITDILEKFPQGIDFDQLFSKDRTRMDMVVTLLAVLELIRLRMIRALQAVTYGTIKIVLAVTDDDPPDNKNEKAPIGDDYSD